MTPLARRYFVALGTTLGLFAPSRSAAQICKAAPPVPHGAVVGADLSVHTYASGPGLSATVGSRQSLSVVASRSYDRVLDQFAYDGGIEIGWPMSRPGSRATFCPAAGYTLSYQPRSVVSGEFRHFHDLNMTAGGAIIFHQRARIASVFAPRLSAHRIWGRGSSGSQVTDVYGMAELSAALLVDRRASLYGRISVPFGLVPPHDANAYLVPFGRENHELGVSMGISVAIGRRRS